MTAPNQSPSPGHSAEAEGRGVCSTEEGAAGSLSRPGQGVSQPQALHTFPRGLSEQCRGEVRLSSPSKEGRREVTFMRLRRRVSREPWGTWCKNKNMNCSQEWNRMVVTTRRGRWHRVGTGQRKQKHGVRAPCGKQAPE